MCLDKRQTNAFIEVWCERTIMCKSLSWTMRRNILLAGQKLRDRRYQNDICVNTWNLFKISGLSESEKPLRNYLEYIKRQPAQTTMLRKKISYKNTYGRSTARLFSSINVPFMINGFCSSTNIRLCVSSRLCLNRNKFLCELKKYPPRNLDGGLTPERVLILMEIELNGKQPIGKQPPTENNFD